jgi:phosphoglycolate phosphatase-like HAD superfamily hydrolase
MKHWVFDLDGTLVDSLTTHFKILKQVFDRFEAEFSEDNHQEVLQVTAKTLLPYLETKLGVDAAPAAHVFFNELNAKAFQTIRPFGGIEKLLRTLQAQGAALALWTARDAHATEKILNHTNLKAYFSIWVSGCCVSQGKPHPEGLQKIAEHFSCSNETMVMVGDFESDMLGAQAFGAKAVRVHWHAAVPVQNCQIADWQFTEVAQFQKWVETMPQRSQNSLSEIPTTELTR